MRAGDHELGRCSMSEPVLCVDGGLLAKEQPAVVNVAVGILQREDGFFLLTTRPPGKAYSGYWEFPGGKVELEESVEQALRRELLEEIGVLIGPAVLWRESRVDYPHARVHLHFLRVNEWSGQLQMHEGQAFVWTALPVKVNPVLPGTLPVLDWLILESKSLC